MNYGVSVSTIFNLDPESVFAALCFLDNFPLWHSGMISVSKKGYLKENMLYNTQTIVLGELNKASVEVIRYEPNTTLELVNNAGIVRYHQLYKLISETPSQTEVICMMQFDLKTIASDLARPVIENMAESRVRGDMETLRSLLAA